MKYTPERRNSFSAIAEQYDRARPSYPAPLYQDLITHTHIPKGGAILEIGSGTGIATYPLALQGYELTCIELSAEMAAVAQKRFDSFANVTIHVGDFEHFPIQDISFDSAFDIVLSAEAFHWIDPKIRYQRAAAALKPTGSIALCWNTPCWIEESQGFFEEVQSVYREIVPDLVKKYDGLLKRPEDIPMLELESLPQSGFFDNVSLHTYPWTETYTTEQYLDVLGTYSDHSTLADGSRIALFDGVAELIDSQYGGEVIKGFMSVLYLADHL